jgi:hypothetical protein
MLGKTKHMPSARFSGRLLQPIAAHRHGFGRSSLIERVPRALKVERFFL